jgi:hypothetical protein
MIMTWRHSFIHDLAAWPAWEVCIHASEAGCLELLMVGDARSAGQVTGSCRESGAETSNHACRMNPAGRCACCSIAANWPVRSAGFHRVSVDAMHLTCGGGVTEVLTFLQRACTPLHYVAHEPEPLVIAPVQSAGRCAW